MNANWDFLEPLDDAESVDLAAESLAVSVQLAVQKAMVRGGVSQKELAERLGVSTPRVSQILSAHGRNMTLKTLGRIAHALGEDFEFIALHDLRELKAKVKAPVRERRSSPALAIVYEREDNPWTDKTANENRMTTNDAGFLYKKVA